jgi:hypothetical protein
MDRTARCSVRIPLYIFRPSSIRISDRQFHGHIRIRCDDLGEDPPGYPALELKRKIAERKRDPSRFIIMDIGQIVPVMKKGQ